MLHEDIPQRPPWRWAGSTYAGYMAPCVRVMWTRCSSRSDMDRLHDFRRAADVLPGSLHSALQT